MAADWVTISSLATAGGTLILAIATFGATRSANRSARASERAVLASLRPVLASSRMEDAMQKVRFQDNVWLRVAGGHAEVLVTDDVIYLAISLRNVGSGMAVLHGWNVSEVVPGNPATADHDPSHYRRLTRDLYIPPGETGFWQGALRDSASPEFRLVCDLIRDGREIAIEILYGDHEGGQRVITRFALLAIEGGYLSATSRHWNIDRADPR